MMNRKNLYEAFYIIEQATRPYLAQRNQKLQSVGIRYSFPSSPSGLGGVLNSGMLNILDDRCEYSAPTGKNEAVSYRDVKTARVTSMGTLEFTLYGGAKKAYTVGKELRDDLSAFFQTALTPFQDERKANLLAQGIYFSFLNTQGYVRGTVNLYADRLEYISEEGTGDTVPFRSIRAVFASDGSLDTALIDGTSKTFFVDRDAQDEVLAFLNEAIAPYIEERTRGFDLCFGSNEKLEINEEQGVFHVIRQSGREITEPRRLEDIIRAEALEGKALREIVGALFTAKSDEAAAPVRFADERVSELSVRLTVRTGEDSSEDMPVSLSTFTFGVSRSSPEYDRSEAEQSALLAYLEAHCPDCEVVPLPPIVVPEPPAELTAAPEAALPAPNPEMIPAPDTGKPEPPAAPVGTLDRGQFGNLIRGISDFVERCGTPMTIAIQGDWETGSSSFIRMIYDSLEESFRGNVLWLYTWQFSQFDLGEQLPMLLADKLTELLGGSINEEAKNRAKMLAQGVIGIASGLLSQGSSDGQKLTDALFKDNLAKTLEQKVRLFSELVKRKAASGNGKVIFFVDDLNRLTPAKVAELLDAMRYFFDCPGCIFMVAVDRETVIRGRQELNGPDYSDEKGDAYFDKIFKTAFRVPRSSFDIQKYIAENLDRVDLHTDSETELRHYSQLARLSVGSDPKALERLFNSVLLLRSLAGEDSFASGERRLALFALLCMQSRFPGAYRSLVQRKDHLTPEFLSSLSTGSVVEEEAGLGEAEQQAFRAFSDELYASINTDGAAGLTDQECHAFAEALAITAITSPK